MMLYVVFLLELDVHGAMSEQSSRRPPLCSMMCHVYTYVPEMFTLFTSEM